MRNMDIVQDQRLDLVTHIPLRQNVSTYVGVLMKQLDALMKWTFKLALITLWKLRLLLVGMELFLILIPKELFAGYLIKVTQQDSDIDYKDIFGITNSI